MPYGLRLAFNLNDYNVTPRRECEDYDDRYVVYNVPLYREQHYNWNSGMALGLCFVRKDAKKSPVKEFRSLLKEASGSINEPYAGSAVYLLSRVEEKLRELEDLGLSTPMDEDDFSYLAKRIEIIDKCSKDLRKVRTERTERIARLCVSDSTGEEK